MFDVNYLQEIGRGTHGIVYMCNDGKTCYKSIFYNNLEYTRKTLKKIKNLKIHNIYKIYDIISTGSIINRELAGYYAEYCEPVVETIIKNGITKKQNKPFIYFSTEYFIRNYYALKDTFEQLYKHNIEIIDLNYFNMIFTEKDILIIDVDNYKKFNPLKKIFGKQKVYDIDHFFYLLLHDEIRYGFMKDEITIEDYRKFMTSVNEKIIDKIEGYANLHDFLVDNINAMNNGNKVLKK